MNTLEISIQNFIRHCKYEKNLSDKTIKAYQTDLKQFQAFFIEKSFFTQIEKITKVELRGYIESISHLKPKSIKRKLATLKAMFNFLEFDEIIIANPFRKMRVRIKEPKQLPKVLNLSEIRAIFKSVYAFNLAAKGSFSYLAQIRNVVVLELLFATGARVSEIANLKDSNIDLQSGQVLIEGKGSKQRIIQICNAETISILKKYRKLFVEKIRAADNYFLINRFQRRLSDQSIRVIVKEACESAQIEMRVTPHVFRHTFATLLLEKDVDIKYIQSMLGHSSIMTTQIYTHVNKEKQKQILRLKHPRRDITMQISGVPE